jgi:hypothetical protein
MSDMIEAIQGIADRSASPASALGTPTRDIQSSSRQRTPSSQINRQPHSVADEEPPRDSFHNESFQEAYSDAKQVMKDLVAVLETSDLSTDPGTTIYRLRDQARSLAAFECPKKRMIGFIGDSGVGKFQGFTKICPGREDSPSSFVTGKSSLINSLLDVKELAASVS